MDYEALVASNRYIGPLFYILFQVFVILVMVNVFLAILNSAYLTIREQDRAEKRKKLAHNVSEM